MHFLTGDGFTPGSGRGQYVIGTFTGTGPSITFILAGDESSQLNALQLRDLTPTATPRITVAMAGKNVSLSWPAAYIGWILQVQTNTVSTRISTNWTDVPGASSGNTNIITITPVTPPALYRLREP